MEPDKPNTLGPFTIIKTLAQGGMGSILLAYDPICKRSIAIKRIRENLKHEELLRQRFLREAEITARLMHPGIIAIFSIYHTEDDLYYTMPYVEGESLKTILSHKPLRNVGSMLSIFYQICQTIAFAHTQHIIHRDLKPANILVGFHGEVLVLDWGLAIQQEEPPRVLDEQDPVDMTTPGKIVGTLAYLAPELFFHEPPSYATDIYALGVILYRMLTGTYPFFRSSFKEAKKNLSHEHIPPPQKVAPYREIPPILVHIVNNCLAHTPQHRYQTMGEVLDALKHYFEGRPIWSPMKSLSIKKKSDWELEENILVSPHFAITQTGEGSEWVHLRIAKPHFGDRVRIELELSLDQNSEGIGILLDMPDSSLRKHLLEGFCFWLSTEGSSQLFHDAIEIARLDTIRLEVNTPLRIVIEKKNDCFFLFINDAHYYTHINYLPLLGTRVGILSKDGNFRCQHIHVLTSSLNLSVSCLKIPDVFLSHKQFKHAFSEYIRIARSFAGYAEGREALFKAGLTLLEEARTIKDPKKAKKRFIDALNTFSYLYKTPAAPLEYLGKSLVYAALGEEDEEIKCLEFALRRYSRHPLLYRLEHHLLFRMHETATTHRKSAYCFIAIALQLLPHLLRTVDSWNLFQRVTTHWEPLYFITQQPHFYTIESMEDKELYASFTTILSFWIAAPLRLQEHIESMNYEILISDAIFALYELGAYDLAHDFVTRHTLDPYLIALQLVHQEGIEEALQHLYALQTTTLSPYLVRAVFYLMQYCLLHDEEKIVYQLHAYLSSFPLSEEASLLCNGYMIWALLQEGDYAEARTLFDQYPLTFLNQDTTILYPLYGCFLAATENEEIAIIFFGGITEALYPKSYSLLGHHIINSILDHPTWLSHSLMWERRKLYQFLTLYYRCLNYPTLETTYRSAEQQEYLSVTPLT